MIIKKYNLNKILFIFLFALSPYSFSGSDALDIFMHSTERFQADFKQVIVGPYGQELESSSGLLMIKRPNQFLLQYQKPDKQQYISNGKKLWIYDEELEQVTIQSLDGQMLSSPAFLISGNVDLKKHYHIKESVDFEHPENDLFILTPLSKHEAQDNDKSLFSNVTFTFNKNILIEIKMQDNFEQSTRLILSKQKVNPTLKNSLFTFKIPDNIDVIGTP